MAIAMNIVENPLRIYFNKWKYSSRPICYKSDSDSNSEDLSQELSEYSVHAGNLKYQDK